MPVSDPQDALYIQIVVIDADAMTAHLLAADLRRHAQFRVIQCAPDWISVSACLAENSPSIVLVGAKSREAALTGLPLLRQIRNQYPNSRTIVLLDHSGRELIAELFRAGVKGVFNRSEYDLQRLCRCICCVASGQIWANSEQLGFVLDVFAETASLNIFNESGEALLTRREKDVVRLVAEGFGNREIAQQLGLSAHTVKNYLFNIFEKLGISSRSELVMYVLANSDNTVARAEDPAEDKGQPQSAKMPVRSYRLNRDTQFHAGPRVLKRFVG
jgi:DNA-binding NarL/FixJ family response regulator